MSYSLYDIYLDNVFDLARSMIIKLEPIAKAMNRKLTDIGAPVPNDRRQWRYYLHLSGQYHELDAPMMVTSLDTSEQILFNRENLKSHKKTRSVYLYDKTYPDALKRKYPEQTMLVDGVLHPVDIEKAINVDDGKVLGYQKYLVEKQEYRLITEVEEYIHGFIYRYNMESLFETQELYAADFSAKLYAFLPSAILDIRNRYVRTTQTHSFHIMAHLASHQRLDEFVQYMTHSQLIYFYRNILYIERHTGTGKTYQKLVENLLTVRGLPLYSYRFRQMDMEPTAGELYPKPIFGRAQENMKTAFSSRDVSDWEVDDVILKEVPLARDNYDQLDTYLTEAQKLGEITPISDTPTKVLESIAVDPEDIDPIKLGEVVINEWMYYAGTGRYTTQFEILNPLNGDTMRLDPKELFLLYIYAYAAGYYGIEMHDIPVFIAKSVLRKEWISDEVYLGMLHHDHFNGWDDEIEFFAKTHPISITEPVTAEDFMDVAQDHLKRKRVRHQYVYQTTRHHERAGRKTMYRYNYTDYLCDFRQKYIKTFDDFFLYLALDKEGMSPEGWQDLSMDALDTATAINSVNNISLKEIQSAMIRMFRRLSSYTIQFAQEIMGGEIAVADPFHVIPGLTLVNEEYHTSQMGLHSTIISHEYKTFSESVNDWAYSNVQYFKQDDDGYFNPMVASLPTAATREDMVFSVTRPNLSVNKVRWDSE